MGAEIHKKINWFWIHLAVFLAAGSLIFGVLKGPSWVYSLSGLGLFSACWSLVSRTRFKDRTPAPLFSLIAMGVHLMLITAGLIFSGLFLAPLQESSLKIPTIGQLYKDPSGVFTIKGPVGWEYVPSGNGLQIKPHGFDQYMGAAEVNIHVRLMDSAPKSPEKFLLKMATSTLTGRSPQGKRTFQLDARPIKLLNNKTGIWAVMDAPRLWIPLRQSSLFGIKKGKYFCSVSVTGLKSHSTLFQVLCLGLYETLEVASPPS